MREDILLSAHGKGDLRPCTVRLIDLELEIKRRHPCNRFFKFGYWNLLAVYQ
jgi:hypothetical protein